MRRKHEDMSGGKRITLLLVILRADKLHIGLQLQLLNQLLYLSLMIELVNASNDQQPTI